MKRISKYLEYMIWMIATFLITFIIEWLHLTSFSSVIHYMYQHFTYFIVNFFIVLATMSIGLIVRRKVFTYTMISLGWLLLATTNFFVTTFRGTPFMFADFYLISEAFKLVSLYFTNVQMLLFLLLVIGILVVIVYSFRFKTSFKKINYLLCGCTVGGTVLGLYLIEDKQLMEPIKSNYIKSYQQYGFTYSFLNTMYPYFSSQTSVSDDDLQGLLDNMTLNFAESYLYDEHQNYNLIIVQLESFMDPMLITGAEYSKDPIATFRELATYFPSGYITVPTFGAGTVMTEFEVLTSISMSAVKPGEIPYDELLCTTPVQSLATIFNYLGYQTTFLHNYEGNFYNRNLAIRNLGFDIYVPLEYMSGDHGVHQIDKTDDPMLFDYIIDTLERSATRDFIYAVTAGTHQPYSTSDGSDAFIVVDGEIKEEYKLPLQDYVNRMHTLDQQIKRLIEYTHDLDEPTLILFFSDHLPNLGAVTDDKTYSLDLYETPYLIYYNTPVAAALPYDNMTSYQIGAYVLNLLGIQEGTMHQVHDTYIGLDDYQNILDIVQKDLLYGSGQFYNNTLLPYSSNLFFGLGDLTIQSVEYHDDTLYVYGDGFSSESRVYLDDEEYETIYVSEQVLEVKAVKKDVQKIEIKQHSGLDLPIGQGAFLEIE